MASLSSYHECFPAEALYTSLGERSFHVHSASQVQRSSVWVLAWNVRTLLDVEGPIKTARQRDDMQVADEQNQDVG